MRERQARRSGRFWVILGGLASVVSGLLLATMALVVVILLTPGNPRENEKYCSSTGVGPYPVESPGTRVVYRDRGTGGFPPKVRCDVYLVDATYPSAFHRLLARESYPGDEAYFWILVCLLSPPALWALLVAVSEAGATRSRR